MSLVITIDGPAGSGKSTVAKELARSFGLIHLNSGNLYRVVGLRAERLGLLSADKPGKQPSIDAVGEAAILGMAREIEFSFELASDGTTRLLVDGEVAEDNSLEAERPLEGSLAQQIRTSHAGELASKVGVLPTVRELLTERQRNLTQQEPSHRSNVKGVVAEGRDAGTVVFPQAEKKFFLEASLAIRALRRSQQLKASGVVPPSVEELEASIGGRDQRDRTRKVAPQIPATDAEVVDTSHMTIEKVVGYLTERIQEQV